MKSSLPIRAVTFDVGGTLIDPWPSVGHVYAEVAARHGVTGATPEELNRRFRAAWKARPDFEYTPADWAEVVNRTFAGLTERPPSETFFPELYERFAQPDAWRIYDDVIPTLEALARGGFKLGILSNWDDRLRPLLARLNLARHFATLVISCELECAKPARRIFSTAAQRLGVEPGALLHVGDSATADVAGARAAGLAALHLRRGAAALGEDEISTLGEVGRRLAVGGGS